MKTYTIHLLHSLNPRLALFDQRKALTRFGVLYILYTIAKIAKKM